MLEEKKFKYTFKHIEENTIHIEYWSIEELEKGRLVITSKLFRPEYTLIDRSFPLDTALR